MILIDAIHLKICDGKVANQPIYLALAVSCDGDATSSGCGRATRPPPARAPSTGCVPTEIKNRGLADVCMVVCDGLAGLPDAVTATWPQTLTQTYVVHLLHNSFRYAGRQHFDAISKALRPVYAAPTEAAATERFLEFCEASGSRYPAIVRL